LTCRAANTGLSELTQKISLQLIAPTDTRINRRPGCALRGTGPHDSNTVLSLLALLVQKVQILTPEELRFTTGNWTSRCKHTISSRNEAEEPARDQHHDPHLRGQGQYREDGEDAFFASKGQGNMWEDEGSYSRSSRAAGGVSRSGGGGGQYSSRPGYDRHEARGVGSARASALKRTVSAAYSSSVQRDMSHMWADEEEDGSRNGWRSGGGSGGSSGRATKPKKNGGKGKAPAYQHTGIFGQDRFVERHPKGRYDAPMPKDRSDDCDESGSESEQHRWFRAIGREDDGDGRGGAPSRHTPRRFRSVLVPLI
jgi:hypothetical protein